MQYQDETTQLFQENEVLKEKLEVAITYQNTYKNKIDQLFKNYNEVLEAELLVIEETKSLKD